MDQNKQAAISDSDGIPPGLDLTLADTVKIIKFTGKFYAKPHLGNVEIHRPVHVYWASKDIFVAQDLQLGNTYVVDRNQNLSLGCLMTAVLLEPTPEMVKQFTEARRQAMAQASQPT